VLEAGLVPRVTSLHACSAPHPSLGDVSSGLTGIFNQVKAIKAIRYKVKEYLQGDMLKEFLQSRAAVSSPAPEFSRNKLCITQQPFATRV